ncbi:deoxyribodipyrimidine photolyase [Rheinheimera sp. A13L]|uniref:FAD-binding domain-containing protein n=1 Tax=Rheinheimera sp. A13L TaxID=506534 RepID=UPI0002124A11|nr:FAD-binding domain-containing protein [Rheinheimera sp. A13L]EGM78684.1 deoxyribodipyrimidine photolyase [Rheinheimera sp. A13L]
MRRALVLFNQAMRWHDNLLLSEQAEFDQLIAVVVLNPDDYLGRQYGIQRASIQRLQAQLKLLLNWQQQWQQKQQVLHIRIGPTDLCLQQLAQLYGADTLIAAEPTAPEQYQQLLQSGLKLKLFDINSLLQHQLRPDLATLPKSFSAFRREREPDLWVQPPEQHAVTTQFHADPSLAVDTTALDFINRYHQPTAALFNEAAGLERLMQFIWHHQAVIDYKQNRNALDGDWNSSLWSFYLANGTLSPCYTWQQVLVFEQKQVANESTYWLRFELLWREYFRWQMRQHGRAWFSKNAFRPPLDFSSPQADPRFELWCKGETGLPFVDANLRMLLHTGWMSNRGRQNVASYLIFELQQDWRLGAAFFEQHLLDYDCASNWCNWAYIAGVGNSSARQFNQIKQALTYDPDGDFVRHWLPGKMATGSSVHQPEPQVPIQEFWLPFLQQLKVSL